MYGFFGTTQKLVNHRYILCFSLVPRACMFSQDMFFTKRTQIAGEGYSWLSLCKG